MGGLHSSARIALEEAELITGSPRTLALLAPHLHARAQAWPSPMMPFIDELLVSERGRAVTIVASGDPLFFGVGASIARRIDASEYEIFPQLSSFALACTRLGWAHEDVRVLSVVARPLDRVRAALHAGCRLIVLSEDGTTPAALAALLVEAGFGASAFTVFEALGGPHERRLDETAATWTHARTGDLNLVAIDVARTAVTPNAARPRLGCVPGLPDEAYANDGQLTKRDARAIVLGRLQPQPGELLWDIGAGSGSIGIEWMRAHPTCRAIAFECDPLRADRITANATALGVPDLRVILGDVPATLAGVPPPQAIFIGGGITAPGVLDAALAALVPGTRLVANAVTLEAEAMVLAAHAAQGGELIRIVIERAAPVGTMTAWRPALPLVQWTLER